MSYLQEELSGFDRKERSRDELDNRSNEAPGAKGSKLEDVCRAIGMHSRAAGTRLRMARPPMRTFFGDCFPLRAIFREILGFSLDNL